MKQKCQWCLSSSLYQTYHDNEWGVPTYDDYKQFEFLILESAQAGLSWSTILNKRDNYKKSYDNFDFNKIAKYNPSKYEELLNNKGIIRNKLKILASINNAKHFIEIRNEFGTFSNYIWKFVNYKPIINNFNDISQIPTKTDLSLLISKDLKKRGFKFLGPTIIYSHMQATGLVNDHITSCFRYKEINDMLNYVINDLKNL